MFLDHTSFFAEKTPWQIKFGLCNARFHGGLLSPSLTWNLRIRVPKGISYSRVPFSGEPW